MSFSCNRPWRLLRLWGFEASTFFRNQLTDGSEVFRLTLAALYLQEDSWYSFLTTPWTSITSFRLSFPFLFAVSVSTNYHITRKICTKSIIFLNIKFLRSARRKTKREWKIKCLGKKFVNRIEMIAVVWWCKKNEENEFIREDIIVKFEGKRYVGWPKARWFSQLLEDNKELVKIQKGKSAERKEGGTFLPSTHIKWKCS